MTRWLLLSLFVVLPGISAAQSVTVRSGEHGDFTRLVLTIPDGTGWDLSPASGGKRVSLTLDAGPYQFDTSSVFDRIGTERISALTPSTDGRGLDIGLACQCAVEAFVLRDTLLVIDVAPSQELVDQADSQPPVAAAVPVNSPLVRELAEIRLDETPRIGPDNRRVSLFADLAGRLDGDRPEVERDTALDMPPGARDLGRMIAADLAIAATEGLLDPALRSPPEPDVPAAEGPEATALPSNRPDDPATLARRLAAGMSGLDHQSLQDGKISVGGDFCIPDSRLAIKTWAPDSKDPSGVLAVRRGRVFGEFDRIAPEALETYARSLVHYGFGAEARAAMSLQPEATDPTLISLSHLVDGENDPSTRFAGMSHCDGAAALWSVLSSPPAKDAPQISEAAILRSFEALPKHLRTHLGPGLAENVAGAGYSATARDILRRLERMEGQETDSIALSKAQLALNDGKIAEVGQRLHDLSVAGGPEAARAVAAAIDLADATDSPVPTRIVELSDAFATELRNSEDGPKLWNAHVRSLLINGEFEAAFAEIDAPNGMPRDAIDAMQQTALAQLVDNADEMTFLKHATRSLANDVLPERASLAIAIAQRLLDIGLPDTALVQLDAMVDPASRPEARITRAKALLALSRPEEAEIILIGQRGEDVARLRAEARRQMGDLIFAKNIFQDIGENGEALQAAWLSGEWKDVAESGTPFAPAAELMQQDTALIGPAEVSLQSADAITAASAKSRQTLNALLAATEIPSDD